MTETVSPRLVVVVTGTGGMGLSIARRLASGRTLVLADARSQSLNAATEALQKEGHHVIGHVVDVSKSDQVEAFAKAAAAHGQLEAVIHTAGVSPVQADAKTIFEVDLLGTANVIDAFYPFVSVATSFVAISSIAGYQQYSMATDLERHLALAPRDDLLNRKELDPTVRPGLAYGLAKRANHLRVQASAKAFGVKGARINTVSPGIISTPMGLQELDGPFGDVIKNMIAVSGSGRIGTADDVTNVVAFLVSSGSSFITGTDIAVDGGVLGASRWAKKNSEDEETT